MHTTRSRNDQVILDCKMRTRGGIIALRSKVIDIVQALLERAKEYVEDVMVSYTHVQHAQPISIAYWLTHYAAIFLRDLDRLKRFVLLKTPPPNLTSTTQSLRHY
jgi:argininosuccinate lyase